MKAGAKKIRRPNRKTEEYFWHLTALFSETGAHTFTRKHWWKTNEPLVTPAAALYEVLRRHPLVSAIHRTSWPEDCNCSKLSYFLWIHGLSTWEDLASPDKEYFVQTVLEEAYPGIGHDIGKGLFDITTQSIDIRGSQALPASAVDSEVRMEELLRFTKEHHLAGRIIIAVDKDLGSSDEANRLFEACYLGHWKKPKKVGRTRQADWLAAIAEFETYFSAKRQITTRSKELFRRYKTPLKGVNEALLKPRKRDKNRKLTPRNPR